MTWQPIETAPRDGTDVLGYDPAIPPTVSPMRVTAWIPSGDDLHATSSALISTHISAGM